MIIQYLMLMWLVSLWLHDEVNMNDIGWGFSNLGYDTGINTPHINIPAFDSC